MADTNNLPILATFLTGSQLISIVRFLESHNWLEHTSPHLPGNFFWLDHGRDAQCTCSLDESAANALFP